MAEEDHAASGRLGQAHVGPGTHQNFRRIAAGRRSFNFGRILVELGQILGPERRGLLGQKVGVAAAGQGQDVNVGMTGDDFGARSCRWSRWRERTSRRGIEAAASGPGRRDIYCASVSTISRHEER
jgi:hypothetical protein